MDFASRIGYDPVPVLSANPSIGPLHKSVRSADLLSSTSYKTGTVMPYKIQRLGLGGVLDQAIAITKDHFGLLFSIMLIVLIPYSLIVGVMNLAIMPALPPHPSAADVAAWQAAQASHWPYFILIGIVSMLFVYPLTNAAVIQAVARLYLGQPVTAIEALKNGMKRLGPLIWTSILMYLAIFGGYILLIIPGIYFSIWFGLSQHVTVIEELSGRAALGRSKRLVHPNRGAFLLLIIVMLVISMSIGFLSNMISMPYLKLIVSSVVQAGFTMFWTAALVVFYFSCRCTVDNFDLQYLARSIGARPPEAEPGLAGSAAL